MQGENVTEKKKKEERQEKMEDNCVSRFTYSVGDEWIHAP